MVKNIFGFLIVFIIIIFYSCNSAVAPRMEDRRTAESKVLQQADGTISLKADKAECYSDMDNPASNTAEWNVLVSKSGRFNVWLSSATIDTTNLQYKNSVLLSIRDNRLEARPACDNIILNSNDVSYPYFRADSFIGSLFIQDTGLYNVQLISEKILPKDFKNDESSNGNSKFLSVFLTPITR